MKLRGFIDFISRKVDYDGVLVFKEIGRNGVYDDEFSTFRDSGYIFYIQAPLDDAFPDYPLDTELHIVPDDNGGYLYASAIIDALEEHAQTTTGADSSEFHLFLHGNYNKYGYREYMFSETTASQISYAGDNVFEMTYSHGKNFLHRVGIFFSRPGDGNFC